MKPDDEDRRFALSEQWWPGLLFWIVVVVIFACIHNCNAANVKLAWNANPETNIAGYELHVGTSPGSYAAPIPTGKVTAYTVADLSAGTTYYFAIKAINTDGLKSNLSAEISHTLPPETPELSREGWEVAGFSSQELVREKGAAPNAIDAAGKTTFWNSEWAKMAPHYIAIKLPKAATVSSMSYTPHQTPGDPDGFIQNWSLQSSMDGIEWEDWASGKWVNSQTGKTELLPLREVRFVKLWGNERYASVSDLVLRGTYTPDPPASLVRLTLQQSFDLSDWSDLSELSVPKKDKQFFRIKIETP
jgi:hypothetical protein